MKKISTTMAIKLCTTLSEEDKAKALKGLRRIARTKEAEFHDQDHVHEYHSSIFKFFWAITEEGQGFWAWVQICIETDFGFENIIPYGYDA